MQKGMHQGSFVLKTSISYFILQENAMNYDKGVLAEILEPIMGKGLIPADLETWKVGSYL